MKYMSTRNHSLDVDFATAMFNGLAPDQGLYIPTHFPLFESADIKGLAGKSLTELGLGIMQPYLGDIPAEKLHSMLEEALNFPIPLKLLEDQLYMLEVFHGPTLAFKDVGARFMAQALAYYSVETQQHINIIVATSGDTGSAIADAFHGKAGIDVYILYPSQKISLLQEKQITTYGGNIHALEVAGTFDDCQRLVKTALSDQQLKSKIMLTTSNSINIARLLPQMIYHAWGLMQLKKLGVKISPILSVPSGNLGNLTSAVYANKMGFAIEFFIAAINSNTVFKDYLSSHVYEPRPSIKTYANAMDVGNPSNFERLEDFYDNNADAMYDSIKAVTISDHKILEEIRRTYERTGFVIDPHTAIGVAAARKYQEENLPIIVTATAHPAKFPEVIKEALQIDIALTPSLERIMSLPKQAIAITTDYQDLLAILSEANS